MKKLFKSIILLFFFLHELFLFSTYDPKIKITNTQTGFCITKIDKIGDFYSVTINNVIVIKDIKLIHSKDKTEIILPNYTTEKEKKYDLVSFLNKNFYNKVLESVMSCNFENTNRIEEPKFRINKFIVNRSLNSKIKVFASVVFDDQLEVECKILKTKRGLIVLWPAKNENGKWISVFEFKSEKYKEKIEKELISKYKVYMIETGE